MAESTETPLNPIPSPREMMRQKRPYLFSDSEIDRSTAFPRASFEYHLETLTARKQEFEFEDFCRKLAEKELCPNLTIQTGPTGGGDGKTDAETYPVAAEIAERWWVGNPSAGRERWAFAFSAKKDWKAKLKSDVKKIAGTGREYDLVYFITNQFAADKDKAKLQDQLSEEYPFRVVILDRSWIVAKVYENGHLGMAISALAIEGAQSDTILKFGPRDAARSAELTELDKQTSDSERYVGARFQLASDCFRSAILARGLERPQAEVEARFEQAIRIADELGTTSQAMRFRYHYAWTAFWWFEDLPKFLKLYDEVEERLAGTEQSSEAKHLHTLYSLTVASISNGRLEPESVDTAEKRRALVAILEPLAKNEARPNNALEAKTYLTLIKTHDAMQGEATDALDECWTDFSEILKASETLGSYPVDLLESVLGELGNVVDSPAFDNLFAELTDVIGQRRSHGAAGQANIKRAFQKLELENPYEAIRWFGRAEELLLKREYREELTEALLGSGSAYSVVGLRWAARNRALVALDHAMMDFREDGDIDWLAWIAVKQLAWAELRLGRVPQALATLMLAKFILAALQPEGEIADQVEDDLISIEVAFGLLLLNLDVGQLGAISKLHDSFEEYDLVIPGMATLFTLGQNQALVEEGYCPEGQTEKDLSDFLQSWINVPGGDQMPSETMLLDQADVEFQSNVLGCNIRVKSHTDPVSVGIAETILGSLESLMATSDESDVLPHKEKFRIVVLPDGEPDSIPSHRLVEDKGASYIEISHSPDFHQDSADKMQRYRDWLQELVVEIVCRFAIVRDIEGWMSKIAADERGFSRAFTFSDMLTVNFNVFGAKPPVRIGDHITSGSRVFTPLREAPLIQKEKLIGGAQPLKHGKGPIPAAFAKPEELKHTDRSVLSPIELDLWDKAGWHGTAFMGYDGMPGPILALHFRDADASRRIFEDWISRWGREGSDENLRISIITGVSVKHPFAYSMHIGPVYRTRDERSGITFTTLSRYMRLDASTPDNLNGFLSAYQKAGTFAFAPAVAVPGKPFPVPMLDLIQPRRRLEVRPAWTIDENDPDMSVIQDDDDPFIPDGQTDPPVRRAIAKMREFRSGKA